jgi:hypothetical protein
VINCYDGTLVGVEETRLRMLGMQLAACRIRCFTLIKMASICQFLLPSLVDTVT